MDDFVKDEPTHKYHNVNVLGLFRKLEGSNCFKSLLANMSFSSVSLRFTKTPTILDSRKRNNVTVSEDYQPSYTTPFGRVIGSQKDYSIEITLESSFIRI